MRLYCLCVMCEIALACVYVNYSVCVCVCVHARARTRACLPWKKKGLLWNVTAGEGLSQGSRPK